MLSSVSWQQFFLYIFAATILYYLFVWIIFFKARLSFLPGIPGVQNFSVHNEDASDEIMTTSQQVIDELRHLFKSDSNKNELLFALQQHLAKYSSWEEPGFRDTITRYISRQCVTICSIRLGDDELRALWK